MLQIETCCHLSYLCASLAGDHEQQSALAACIGIPLIDRIDAYGAQTMLYNLRMSAIKACDFKDPIVPLLRMQGE